MESSFDNITVSVSQDEQVIAATILTDEQAISVGISPSVYKGKDGLVPFVGENGNWWLRDLSTGEVQDSGAPVSYDLIDYNCIQNKPRINDVVLMGNMNAVDLHLGDAMSNFDILSILT